MNLLSESPWYIAYVISTLLVTLIEYRLLKINWKKLAKPIDYFFEFLIQDQKQILFFLYGLRYCNQELCC